MFIIIMTVIIFAKIQIISEYTSIMKEKMQFAFLFLKIFLEKRLHIHAQAIDILRCKCEPCFLICLELFKFLIKNHSNYD